MKWTLEANETNYSKLKIKINGIKLNLMRPTWLYFNINIAQLVNAYIQIVDSNPTSTCFVLKKLTIYINNKFLGKTKAIVNNVYTKQ